MAVTGILGYTLYTYKGKSKHLSQVKIPINTSLFEEKLTKGPSPWALEQIHSDLKAYEKTGISKQSLDNFFYGQQNASLYLIRFTIKDRIVSFSLTQDTLLNKQFRHLLAALQKLNEIVVLPDVDFIMSLHDGFKEELGIPLFVYAKSKAASSLLLMPDFKALTGYPSLRQEMEQGNLNWPWNKKIDKAFWRGSSTGDWMTLLNWDKIARVKLALLALSHPDKIDARITGVVQCDPEIPQLVYSKGITGGMVTQKDHLKYKYLVDVDGNTCTFERYFWALLSNSVVLKQMTPNIQWYYGGLKPYVHFVPVNEDLSDLLEKIQWAGTHDREAKQIAENATAFIKEELSLEDVFVYMTCLLREYAKLFNNPSGPNK